MERCFAEAWLFGVLGGDEAAVASLRSYLADLAAGKEPFVPLLVCTGPGWDKHTFVLLAQLVVGPSFSKEIPLARLEIEPRRALRHFDPIRLLVLEQAEEYDGPLPTLENIVEGRSPYLLTTNAKATQGEEEDPEEEPWKKPLGTIITAEKSLHSQAFQTLSNKRSLEVRFLMDTPLARNRGVESHLRATLDETMRWLLESPPQQRTVFC